MYYEHWQRMGLCINQLARHRRKVSILCVCVCVCVYVCALSPHSIEEREGQLLSQI